MSPDDAEIKSASEQSEAPSRGRRRSRRGGRRHSRRREQRAPEPPAGDTPAPTAVESPQPAVEEAEERQEVETPQGPAAISDAIEQVNRVIDELKHALDEMEEVLETLELAERQKIEDEREIQYLQRALRQLHRPREHEPRH